LANAKAVKQEGCFLECFYCLTVCSPEEAKIIPTQGLKRPRNMEKFLVKSASKEQPHTKARGTYSGTLTKPPLSLWERVRVRAK